MDLIAALLSRHYGISLEELRDEVPAYRQQQSGPTMERMFERDKKELRAFGIPIESITLDEGPPEKAGYRLRARDFYLPFLAVAGSAGKGAAAGRSGGMAALPELACDPDELAAVAAAAARVKALGDPYLAADVDSAVRKLAVDLPIDTAQAGAGERIVADRVDARTFAALGAAVQAHKFVEFDYHKMGDESTGRRSVEPYGLAFLGSSWYLVARDRGHGELRHFRLSRARGIQVNRSRDGTPDFQVPDDFRLAAHAASREAWELGDGDVAHATVDFRVVNGATRAAARLGEAVKGRPSLRQFRVRRGDAFVRWLLAFGGAAVPIEPAELVERYRDLARATLALYEQARS